MSFQSIDNQNDLIHSQSRIKMTDHMASVNVKLCAINFVRNNQLLQYVSNQHLPLCKLHQSIDFVCIRRSILSFIQKLIIIFIGTDNYNTDLIGGGEKVLTVKLAQTFFQLYNSYEGTLYVNVSIFVHVRLFPFSRNPVGMIFLAIGIGNYGFQGFKINDSQSISKPNFRDPLVLALPVDFA